MTVQWAQAFHCHRTASQLIWHLKIHSVTQLTLEMSVSLAPWHTSCSLSTTAIQYSDLQLLGKSKPLWRDRTSLVGLFYLEYYGTHKHHNTSQQDGRAEVKNHKCELTHFFSIQLQQRQQTLVIDLNQCLSEICQQRQEINLK